MKQSRLPIKPAKLFALSLIAILSGCATTTTSVAPTDRVYCSIAAPIYWSKNDTDKTIAQVKEANAAWKSLCQKTTPKTDKIPSAKPVAFKDRWYEGVKLAATVFR